MIRLRDVLETGRRSALPHATRSPLRRAGLLVWVLPALVVVTVATLWWATPSNPEGNASIANAPQPAAPSIDATKRPPRLEPRAAVAPVTNTPDGGDIPIKKTADDEVRPTPESPTLPPPMAKSLAETEQGVIGEWSGFYQGQRHLTVREGGKATMVVEPEGVAAYLLAPKVTFEILWKVHQDQLEFDIIGGDPLDKVKVVTNMYGKRRVHKILELQPEKIVLLDEDGVTEYVWNRNPPECR